VWNQINVSVGGWHGAALYQPIFVLC